MFRWHEVLNQSRPNLQPFLQVSLLTAEAGCIKFRQKNPGHYISSGVCAKKVRDHAAKQYQSRFSPEKAQEKTSLLMRALNQCVMIDMDMAISIYLEENQRAYDAKLNDLAQNFESTIGGIVSGVSSAATEMEASAESLAAMARKTSAGAETVAAASQDASGNVAAVSSATEEMSVSIAGVADLRFFAVSPGHDLLFHT